MINLALLLLPIIVRHPKNIMVAFYDKLEIISFSSYFYSS